MDTPKVSWWYRYHSEHRRDVMADVAHSPNGIITQICISKGLMDHPKRPWDSIVCWDWDIIEWASFEPGGHQDQLEGGYALTLREAKKQALAAWEKLKAKNRPEDVLRFFPKMSQLLGEVKA